MKNKIINIILIKNYKKFIEQILNHKNKKKIKKL